MGLEFVILFLETRVFMHLRMFPLMEIDNFFDSCLEQMFKTIETGLQSSVEHAAIGGDAEFCSREQSILLGMYANTKIISLASAVGVPIGASFAPTFLTILHAYRGAIVSC